MAPVATPKITLKNPQNTGKNPQILKTDHLRQFWFWAARFSQFRDFQIESGEYFGSKDFAPHLGVERIETEWDDRRCMVIHPQDLWGSWLECEPQKKTNSQRRRLKLPKKNCKRSIFIKSFFFWEMLDTTRRFWATGTFETKYFQNRIGHVWWVQYFPASPEPLVLAISQVSSCLCQWSLPPTCPTSTWWSCCQSSSSTPICSYGVSHGSAPGRWGWQGRIGLAWNCLCKRWFDSLVSAVEIFLQHFFWRISVKWIEEHWLISRSKLEERFELGSKTWHNSRISLTKAAWHSFNVQKAAQRILNCGDPNFVFVL